MHAARSILAYVKKYLARLLINFRMCNLIVIRIKGKGRFQCPIQDRDRVGVFFLKDTDK